MKIQSQFCLISFHFLFKIFKVLRVLFTILLCFPFQPQGGACRLSPAKKARDETETGAMGGASADAGVPEKRINSQLESEIEAATILASLTRILPSKSEIMADKNQIQGPQEPQESELDLEESYQEEYSETDDDEEYYEEEESEDESDEAQSLAINKAIQAVQPMQRVQPQPSQAQTRSQPQQGAQNQPEPQLPGPELLRKFKEFYAKSGKVPIILAGKNQEDIIENKRDFLKYAHSLVFLVDINQTQATYAGVKISEDLRFSWKVQYM